MANKASAFPSVEPPYSPEPRGLFQYLESASQRITKFLYELAQRANACLPSDGSEPITGALSGADALPILVNPWEPVSINIVCVQVIVLPYENPGSYFYAFAGNSFSPDVMVWGVSEGNGAIGSKL